MDCRRYILPAVGLSLCCATILRSQVIAPEISDTEPPPAPPAVAADDQPERARPREITGEPIPGGPVHEAFAEPLVFDPKPGRVLPQPPPAPVDEIPPQTKPEGKDVSWFSGYWAWEDARDAYVWVSGVWRRVPKGRRWQKGYWREVDGGHQWVPGAWLKEAEADGEKKAKEEVLPLPPESLEEGPTGPAPSDDHFWVPGVWQHKDGRYAWRPGFWTPCQENWVWIPDHYVWVPGGCRFVPGYWDCTWERRGTLYAPCTFGPTDLLGRVCYRPTQAIDTSRWLLNLWIHPGRHHYYFGNYSGLSHHGYLPWYTYDRHRHRYDPLYTHYRWVFRLGYGSSLYSHLHGLHLHYSRYPHLRPSLTLHRHDLWHKHYGRHLGYHTAFGKRDALHRYGTSRFSDRYLYQRGQAVHNIVERQRRSLGGSSRHGDERLREQLRRSGVTRQQMGTRGSTGITRQQMGTGRNSSINRGRGASDRGRSSLDAAERARRALRTSSRGSSPGVGRNSSGVGITRQQIGTRGSAGITRDMMGSGRGSTSSRHTAAPPSGSSVQRVRNALSQQARNAARASQNSAVARTRKALSPSPTSSSRSDRLRSARQAMSSLKSAHNARTHRTNSVQSQPSRGAPSRAAVARHAARTAAQKQRDAVKKLAGRNGKK